MNQAGLVPGFWGGAWGRDDESGWPHAWMVSCKTGNIPVLLSVDNVHASHCKLYFKPTGVFKHLFGLYTINH